jgi:hypothetical protein
MLFEDAIEQLRAGGTTGQVNLLTPGSFLDAAQISERNQERMVVDTWLELKPRTIRIESRPEHVSLERLGWLAGIIEGTRLEVAIGLETSDQEKRLGMGKGFTNADFENAVRLIKEAGAYPVTYLLTGFPEENATGEAAHRELVASAGYLEGLAGRVGTAMKIALECFFPNPNNPSEPAAYLTPAFVADAAMTIVERFGMRIEIATWDEGYGNHRLDAVKSVIDEFNETQDLSHLRRILL